MFDLVKELTEIIAPCGEEGPILDRAQALWDDVGLETERTGIGNVLARLGGTGRRLLLAAHGDELSFVVRDVHPDGFLWLGGGQGWTRTWSVRNAFTIGQPVKVLAREGAVDGIVAAATGHLAVLALPEPSELGWSDLWVETGLSREELAARGVTPGTRVVWSAETVRLGEQVTGKALDDRVGLAVLVELARRVHDADLVWDVTLACTVQEEIGSIGASAIVARERFDAAVVVEIGLAGDIPGVPDDVLPVRLGHGPALIHKDAGVHYDHALTGALERCAAAGGIPIQHGVLAAFASDGASLMRADVPTAMTVFPARYTHTPFETAHLRDVELLVDWLARFVTHG
jgi:endoglucanase